MWHTSRPGYIISFKTNGRRVRRGGGIWYICHKKRRVTALLPRGDGSCTPPKRFNNIWQGSTKKRGQRNSDQTEDHYKCPTGDGCRTLHAFYRKRLEIFCIFGELAAFLWRKPPRNRIIHSRHDCPQWQIWRGERTDFRFQRAGNWREPRHSALSTFIIVVQASCLHHNFACPIF